MVSRKKVGRPKAGQRAKRRFQVVLDPTIAEKLRLHGSGNLSLGIAKAAQGPGLAPRRKSMTHEELRKEEANALERERLAFERRQKAFFAVHRQFLPFGNGQPTMDSLDEQEAAEREWRLACEEVERIVQEIRAGLR